MSDFDFFKFLWVRRHPVYDDAQVTTDFLVDDFGNPLVDDEGNLLLDDESQNLIFGNLYRWV